MFQANWEGFSNNEFRTVNEQYVNTMLPFKR